MIEHHGMLGVYIKDMTPAKLGKINRRLKPYGIKLFRQAITIRQLKRDIKYFDSLKKDAR
jgi:hypothetical protein